MYIDVARDVTQKGRTVLRGLILPTLLVSLTACTSLINPYIDVPRTPPTYAEADPFPELRQAAEDAEKLRQKALNYRKQHVVTRSLLGYGVFGAAAAGGVVALYDGPRDLVLGLGLGAGGAYIFGELFVSTDKVTIYSAAARALNCVVGAADAVSATGKILATLTARSGGTYWQRDNDLGATLAVLANDDSEEVAEAWTARAEYAAAVANLETFKALDPNYATAANQAAGMILEAMEQRISAVQPNLDAVARAAEGISGLGVAYVKRVAPKKPDPNEMEETKRKLGYTEGTREENIKKATSVRSKGE